MQISDKVLDQITNTINDEIVKHDALSYQFEYLKKQISPQDIQVAIGEFRTKQLNNLDFAIEIMDKVQKADFHPFLSGSSLLGAIRHKGFIPWKDNLDFGLMSHEFWSLRDFIKDKFHWIDSSGQTNIPPISHWAFLDKALKEYPNQIFGMQSPYCMYLYKGTCLENFVSIEFFPYYYLKDSIDEAEYKNHQKIIHRLVSNAPNYGLIFKFYDELLENYSLACSDSNKIAAGVNHKAFTEMEYKGFFEKSSIFPLKNIEFEGHELPTLNDPHAYLSMIYGDYMSLPNDIGFNPMYSDMNKYLSTQNRKLSFPEAFIL